ncbi:MAG TPA: hypothetical protein VF230_11995 [Acidimicrobiales bacterium]
MTGANAELVELGDMEELGRHIERLCAAEAWDELYDLRDLCRKALDRGRQLWPIAARAEYRLALDAPGEWAAKVLVPGAGRFTPGPLAEVAACNHTWSDLAPFLEALSPDAAVFAHERVVRGEVLTSEPSIATNVLDLPLETFAWEGTYPVAVYERDRVDFPLEPPQGLAPMRLARAGAAVDDEDAVRALRDLAGAWTGESNGRSEAVAVRGTAAAAIAALGVTECRAVEVAPAAAMARMAWVAASGGAHGRRRGMAAGRFGAWWAAAALTEMLDEWPVDGHELGHAVLDLRWYVWDPGGPETGWTCRLAVDDPAEHLAWAFSATDASMT